MRILCKLLQKDWSWGLGVDELINALPEYEFIKILIGRQSDDFDIILAQNLVALKNISHKNLHKTICRLGSNRQFDDKENRKELNLVHAVIATNKRLYEIGKTFNDNVYLIPNGLDLTKWQPVQKTKQFTVGFAGNVKGFQYGDYKGFSLVKEACGKINTELKTALYKDNQIPYSEMRDKFYSQISCLVLPTLGEGNSNVIMESLSCGVPVLTTKEAGFHGEKLTDGVNCLFITRDAKDIATKIERLRDSHRLRESIALNGREFAKDNHDIKKIACEYKKLFDECYLNATGKQAEMQHDTDTLVNVRFLQNAMEEDLNHILSGTIKKISLYRAKQLGDIVEIL